MQGKVDKVENYFFLAFEIRSKYPVLLVVVRDFCFWAIWAAKPVHKKVFGTNYEQVLRAFFSCFRGQYIFFQLFWNPYSICSKKLHGKIFKNETNWSFLNDFLKKKTGFYRAAKKCTTKKVSYCRTGCLDCGNFF